ncbi:hypothetical protein [Veillonella criceti]|uniref:Uncharacterized protein n=1 Tax=Veillonella criceti TaxID=103891 RepID=A0A380NNT2_9FIRM|nr:hypothetical protein [Veillonella criceti]SUP44364.1 Uncharacterised protein [Veillonella criceti]
MNKKTSIQDSTFIKAVEVMTDAVHRNIKTVFFTVNTMDALNEICANFGFYDYNITPFTMEYNGKTLACYATKAEYNPKKASIKG